MSKESSRKLIDKAPQCTAIVRFNKAATGQSNQSSDDDVTTIVITSYREACQSNPEFEPLHATAQKCTDRVIKNLDGAKVPCLSLDSVGEITGGLQFINEKVINFLINCEEGILKDKVIGELVNEYRSTSFEIIKFCNTLQTCVKGTRNNLSRLGEALRKEEVDGKNYSRTLKELKNFKANGDPFRELVHSSYDLLYEKINSLVLKLGESKKNLDKKRKSSTLWKKAWDILCVAAVASVLILSVVVAPPLGMALPPMVATFTVVDILWENYEKELKLKRDVVDSISHKFTDSWIIEELQIICMHVDQLVDDEMNSLAMKNENEVNLVTDAIKRKLSESNESLDNLWKKAVDCSRIIEEGRLAVWKKIIQAS